jgi:hypothetical protein
MEPAVAPVLYTIVVGQSADIALPQPEQKLGRFLEPVKREGITLGWADRVI